jgi:hypothetical protein
MHDSDDSHELVMLLSDGTVVSMTLVAAVERVRAEGHTVTVTADEGVRVTPPIDPLSLELHEMDSDWPGTLALVAAGH